VGSETPALLKEEINKTQEAEHDLAKWKLAVTAALGAAAFGFSKEGGSSYWLLFLVPFACAYVDLYDYQYRLRVLEIAVFLRGQTQDPVLQAYEKHCADVRKGRNFNLGKVAGIGSSLCASLFGPAFYELAPRSAIDTWYLPEHWAMTIWWIGIALVVYLYVDFDLRERKLRC
jgi:hypothetical protein